MTVMALKKNNMAFKMKAGPAGPMVKNYGPMLMASPMKDETLLEKAKIKAKAFGKTLSLHMGSDRKIGDMYDTYKRKKSELRRDKKTGENNQGNTLNQVNINLKPKQ